MTHKILDKYNELKRERPNLDHELVMTFIEDMSDEASMLFDKLLFGCHIGTRDFYDKVVSLLEWSNGSGKGEKWSPKEVEQASGINFDDKDYYLYDFAYIMNMLYSDYGHIFVDTNQYIKMSKAYLEDADYMGDPAERAYHNAKKRIKYHDEKEYK